MKKGLYLRLALDGMRKNRRLYLPYLLTGACMVMMFYIRYALGSSPLMRTMRGVGRQPVCIREVVPGATGRPVVALTEFGKGKSNAIGVADTRVDGIRGVRLRPPP